MPSVMYVRIVLSVLIDDPIDVLSCFTVFSSYDLGKTGLPGVQVLGSFAISFSNVTRTSWVPFFLPHFLSSTISER